MLLLVLLLLLLKVLRQVEVVRVDSGPEFSVGAVGAVQVAVGRDQIWSQTFLQKKRQRFSKFGYLVI